MDFLNGCSGEGLVGVGEMDKDRQIKRTTKRDGLRDMDKGKQIKKDICRKIDNDRKIKRTIKRDV